ncbi:MAG TPA: hypothetical protein VMZ22_06925 [Acidimicrobiales bacterium]|nr:hypothetical protein [Acidimicrobiales bacterium]
MRLDESSYTRWTTQLKANPKMSIMVIEQPDRDTDQLPLRRVTLPMSQDRSVLTDR